MTCHTLDDATATNYGMTAEYGIVDEATCYLADDHMRMSTVVVLLPSYLMVEERVQWYICSWWCVLYVVRVVGLIIFTYYLH